MMEFWPENQGQSHLYSRFGTVPGRNCSHNYHDRHQTTHYPLYYGEQQDQGRESSYWTVPGSRTGGPLLEYTNWRDPDLTASSSSHFPFILDRHTQHHQDLTGEYQSPEARDREWTAAHRAVRDCDRGFLREGWQKRWEPCSPVRYNREVPAKRSDSSYRELEAWAARYSHSLPRRRRIEAELRGASQGLVENSRLSERDSRGGTDPQVAALHHVQQSANIRDSRLWDRGARQQAPTYYPAQAPAPETSHMLDMKEHISYHRRIFSQPPGYIAPPPYHGPHKSSPVTHHCDTSQEQGSKWTLRKQEIAVDLQDKRRGEKEGFTKPDESKMGTEPGGLKLQRQGADALQADSFISVQNTHIQREHTVPLQHPQAVHNSKIIKETSSKVIEGRKFRLSKKTGGMTIFCLVSRIASTTETPSFTQTNIQSAEIGQVSKAPRDRGEASQMHKLADEVDFSAPTLTDFSNVRNLTAKQKETPSYAQMEMLGDNLASKAEAKGNDFDPTFGKQAGQSVQPVSAKYPLWREPNFTSRAETESSPTCCLKVNSEEEKSGSAQNQYDCSSVSHHPIDIEVRRLDIKEDTEDSKGLLVIDTTCVVVKMELIPSPKKEHVHYLDSTAQIEDAVSDIHTVVSQLNQDEQNTEETALQMNESPKTDLDSIILEEEEQKGESEISPPNVPSSPFSERETLEERAERILGISLYDHISEQQPKNVPSLQEQDEEAETPPIKTEIHNAIKQTAETTTEEEESQNDGEVVQTEDAMHLTNSDDARDQMANENGDDFTESQEQVLDLPEENNIDSQLETGIKTSTETEMTEDPLLESPGEKGTREQGQEESESTEDDQSSKPSDLIDSSLLSPSDLTSHLSITESNTEEDPNLELAALNTSANLAPDPEVSSLPQIPLHQLPSPVPSESTDSAPHSDHSPSPPPPPLYHTGSENQNEHDGTLHVTENEVNNESLAMDMTAEDMSRQQLECVQPDDAACVVDEQQTEEADVEPAAVLEQKVETFIEEATDVNTLQQQCVQSEDVACLKENNVTEEQSPKEVSEDPEGLSAQSSEPDEENEHNASETEVKIFQQQFCYGQEEEALCAKESCMTENESQETPDEPPAGIWEQSTCKNTPADSQIENISFPDIDPMTETCNPSSPSASNCETSLSPSDEHSIPELPSPPHASDETDTESVSLLDTDSVYASPLISDTACIPETDPPFNLDSCEESLQFLPPSLSDLPSDPPPSSAPPPQEESSDFPPSTAHKEELQYPKSLWDVVNRIRKHTAPDSENEEEEVSELWDPENLGEDSSCPDVFVDMNSERIVFNEADQQEDIAETGQIQQDHKEPSGRADEDALSCSSSSSHSSGDTVIVADEDEDDETTHGAVIESKAETENDVFDTANRELCCSNEVIDETTGKENEDEEQDEAQNQSCQSEECSGAGGDYSNGNEAN